MTMQNIFLLIFLFFFFFLLCIFLLCFVTTAKQHFLAVSDDLGMVRVFEIPRTFSVASKTEVGSSYVLTLKMVWSFLFVISSSSKRFIDGQG